MSGSTKLSLRRVKLENILAISVIIILNQAKNNTTSKSVEM